MFEYSDETLSLVFDVLLQKVPSLTYVCMTALIYNVAALETFVSDLTQDRRNLKAEVSF